jgi:hypothetical protein
MAKIKVYIRIENAGDGSFSTYAYNTQEEFDAAVQKAEDEYDDFTEHNNDYLIVDTDLCEVVES